MVTEVQEQTANNTDLTTEQVNELYDKIHTPGTSNIPMDDQKQTQTYELAEGVNATQEQLMEYAKKGLNYDQQLADFNKQKEQYDPLVEKYKTIDEHAINNPDWWDHVQKSYEDRESFANNPEISDNNVSDDQQLSPELQSIQTQLNDIKQFISGQTQQAEMARKAQEDEKLESEITGIKEQHPYLDFATPDDKGQSLEQKVLAHAQKLGTDSFRVAFRDLAHDQLISKARETGAESVNKSIQRNTKLGILGSADKSVKSKPYSKAKSYEDLTREALEEYGIK